MNHVDSCTTREDVHGTIRPEVCPFCAPWRAAVRACIATVEAMPHGDFHMSVIDIVEALEDRLQTEGPGV